MKKLLCLLAFTLILLRGVAQSQIEDEKAILNFLSYVASKEWVQNKKQTMKHFDTLTERHLIFYKNDTTNLKFRTNYLLGEIRRLRKQILQVNKNNLQVVPYNNAPDSLQIVKLTTAFRERSYIAFDRTGIFRRYFLMEGGKVDAFVLWGKTAFAKLN